MIIDLTNLISTIISATASLVAIIGGFLVSRVISLASEKSSITRRLREIDNELDTHKKMLESIELILLEDDVDDFIYDHAKDILIGEEPIEDLLEKANYSRLTRLSIDPYITKLHEIFKCVETFIDNTSSDYILPNNFDDFIRDNKIKIEEYKEWYEIVYKIILDFIPKNKSDDTVLGVSFAKINPISYNLHLPRIKSPVVAHERIKERNNLQNEIQILSGFKEEQMKILKDYGQISGLWSGLVVLIYACIVGIVIPSLLLPYPLEVYDDLATKRLLLSLFFSQLVALFVYLIISMYKLTKKDSKV